MTAARRSRLREQPLAPPLLMTKLQVPSGREQVVSRARLLDRLDAGAEIKLTVVAAPPGYGKTTLLEALSESAEGTRPLAWVTLDEGDNDPVAFWSYVVEALRRARPMIEIAVSPQAAGPTRIVDLLLPELVNALTEVGEVALVLDDFHRISSSAVREGVAWLVEHAPATFQFVIATRNEPALPLAALRAHGALLELRADELGFTPAEADLLLNDRLRLNVDREAVDDLVERTEGWPAGIYLAALSSRGADDPGAFLRAFGGRNRDVVDFLVDEVLDAFDAETQELMLRSSILERLSGRLCDAVLEREGSAECLASLARTNLFVVPLDDHGEWYRFHQLFAQLLRVELEHREPQLAPALHRRAFAWYREHGSSSEAIGHATEAGAFDDVVALISEVWIEYLSAGRSVTVLNWVKRLPAEVVRDNRPLLLVEAWVHSFMGDRDQAATRMASLERLGWPETEPLPDGASSLEAILAMMRAGFPGGDVGEGYRNALRAAELETPGSPMWSTVCWALGMCCYYQGDLDAADRAFAEAAETGAEKARWLVAASALARRSFIAGDRGDVEAQRSYAEQAATLARERGVDEALGDVHVSTGEWLAARGELDAARSSVARGVGRMRSLHRPLELVNALIRQVRILQATGELAAAAAALAEARATIEGCADPGILPDRVAALRRRSRPRNGNGGLTARELVVLRMLSGPLTEREIGRELYLSHNTIHSHTRSIYRKLGVSARREATDKARELRLL